VPWRVAITYRSFPIHIQPGRLRKGFLEGRGYRSAQSQERQRRRARQCGLPAVVVPSVMGASLPE
jgi:hypothetical protein